MDAMKLLSALVSAAGPEIRLPGRELLQLVQDAPSAPLWPTPPEWVQGVAGMVGRREGVSPALLEAISGELSGWDPELLPSPAVGERIGLMGLPLELLEDDGHGQMVASLEDLEDGDRKAAERVRLNVTRAARYIATDTGNARLVHVLEYYVGLGQVAPLPTAREIVRHIMARYLWRLLAQLPPDRAAELLESFDPKTNGRS